MVGKEEVTLKGRTVKLREDINGVTWGTYKWPKINGELVFFQPYQWSLQVFFPIYKWLRGPPCTLETVPDRSLFLKYSPIGYQYNPYISGQMEETIPKPECFGPLGNSPSKPPFMGTNRGLVAAICPDIYIYIYMYKYIFIYSRYIVVQC